jgi:type I restriction enzyme S subunit
MNFLSLGELCKINPPRDELKNLSDSTDVSFVPMSAVNEEGRIVSPKIRQLKDVKKGYTYFRNDDILFAKITPCMENGKAAIARDLMSGIGFGSTEFHVIRRDSKVTTEWIYYFLRQKSFRRLAEMNMTGTAGQKRVPKAFLENTKIPVPPIDVQNRIVARIQELMQRIEYIRRLHDSSIKRTELILPSSLSEVFTTLFEEKYGLTRLDNCFRKIDSGSTPRKEGDNYIKKETGIPFIKVEHITPYGDVLVNDDNPRINRLIHEGQMKRSMVSGKAILVNIVGPPLGKVGLIREDVKEANINQAIVALRDSTSCINEYVWYCMRSPRYNTMLKKLGIGIRQSNINISQIREFKIPVPPMNIQQKIVNSLQKIRSYVDQLLKLQKQAEENINSVSESILDRAFRGDLIIGKPSLPSV